TSVHARNIVGGCTDARIRKLVIETSPGGGAEVALPATPGANEVQISKNEMPSFIRGCPAHNGSAPAASQNTSKPPSFLPSKCACRRGGNFRANSLPRSRPPGAGRK